MHQKLTVRATLTVTRAGRFNLAELTTQLAHLQAQQVWLADPGELVTETPEAITYALALENVPAQFCAHGHPTLDNPDYAGRCSTCDREEYADLVCDQRRGT